MKTAADLDEFKNLQDQWRYIETRWIVRAWLKQFGYKCPSCKAKMLYEPERRNSWRYASLDHILPMCRGGTYALNNLRVICQRCNGKKGSSLPTTRNFR